MHYYFCIRATALLHSDGLPLGNTKCCKLSYTILLLILTDKWRCFWTDKSQDLLVFVGLSVLYEFTNDNASGQDIEEFNFKRSQSFNSGIKKK